MENALKKLNILKDLLENKPENKVEIESLISELATLINTFGLMASSKWENADSQKTFQSDLDHFKYNLIYVTNMAAKLKDYAITNKLSVLLETVESIGEICKKK